MYLDNIQTVVLIIARELHIQMKNSKYCVCAWPTLFQETKVPRACGEIKIFNGQRGDRTQDLRVTANLQILARRSNQLS